MLSFQAELKLTATNEEDFRILQEFLRSKEWLCDRRILTLSHNSAVLEIHVSMLSYEMLHFPRGNTQMSRSVRTCVEASSTFSGYVKTQQKASPPPLDSPSATAPRMLDAPPPLEQVPPQQSEAAGSDASTDHTD